MWTMAPDLGPHSSRRASIAAAALLGLLALGGCGSSDATPAATVIAASSTPQSCAATVVQTLGHVIERVYHEGVASERTIVARRLIDDSRPLAEAVERDDPTAARTAAAGLVATGKLTDLRVTRGGRTIVAVGRPALAPLTGTLTGAGGQAIGTYTTSVWSDRGFLIESGALAEGRVSLRAGGHTVGGSFALPGANPAREGSVVIGHTPYQYSSFAGEAYPSGDLTVYVLRTTRGTQPLCGASDEATTVRTLTHIATLIYGAEKGPRTLPQIRRVQRNQPLLQAVAQRSPQATRVAVEALLHQHIVRLRVTAGGQLLDDDGGPYVLAPVAAPLRLGGRTIGRILLSIQDDEGYLRLTRRLVGLRVLMYMDVAGRTTLVKNSLGPEPGAVPESGSFRYRGSSYRVFTLHATAFPSGPLAIRVLIPIPYT